MIPENPHDKRYYEFMSQQIPIHRGSQLDELELCVARRTSWQECKETLIEWLEQYGCEYENEKGERFYEIYIPLEQWKELKESK